MFGIILEMMKSMGRKISHNSLARAIFILGLWFAESAGNGLVLYDLLNDSDEYTEGYSDENWSSFALATMLVIPTIWTMAFYWGKSQDNSESKRIEPLPETPSELQLSTEHSHQHGMLTETGEFFAITGTFSMTSYAGSYFFFKSIGLPSKGAMALAALAGSIDGAGNYILHHFHHSHPVGIKKLFARLIEKREYTQLAYSLYAGAGIFLGHPIQGFYASHLFLKAINCNTFWIEIPVRALMAGLVTYFEGITEMRSLLTQINASILDDHASLSIQAEDVKEVGYKTRIALAPSAFLHSLLPTIGLLKLIEYIADKIDSTSTAANLPLKYRIPIAVVAYLLVGLPNAIGNFHTTLPGFAEAVETGGEIFTKVSAKASTTRQKITNFFQQRDPDDEEARRPLLGGNRHFCC